LLAILQQRTHGAISFFAQGSVYHEIIKPRLKAVARWLTAAGTPAAALLARVTVNRLWQQHFGVGIVATPDNLGYSGAAPSHPELLEFLAAEFADSRWSTKQLVRSLVTSAAFRQSSRPHPRGWPRRQ
jgi:hypothetical protein